MSSSLQELINNGLLWSGPAKDPEPIEPSFYYPRTPEPSLIKSKVQEIFFFSGLENQKRNFWLPAYNFACQTISSLKKHSTHQLKIAWISKSHTPNLTFIYSHKIETAIHLIFHPEKKSLFSFTRKVIKENCFQVIISSLEDLSFAQTRSLQLASQNTNSLILILRPPWEIKTNSASFIKYLIKPSQSPQGMAWETEIVKIKSRL